MGRYSAKSEAELGFIVKDASEAAECARAMGNAVAEGKYRDQVCDAASERYRRKQPAKASRSHRAAAATN